MDGGSWEAAVVEEIVEEVHGRLRVAEDDSATWLHREEQVVEGLALGIVVDVDDMLANVLVGLTSAADANAHVIRAHEVASELAGALGEGSREHHVDMVGVLVGVCLDVSL